MANVRREGGEPFDRVTEIANEIIDSATQDQVIPDDAKVIVFVNDATHGGIGMHNYLPDADRDNVTDAELQDANVEAITDLFIHLKALMNAAGKDVHLVPLDAPIGQG